MSNLDQRKLRLSEEQQIPENLDRELVHRVLLTDPSQFQHLTMSHERLEDTPSFSDFERSLNVRQRQTPGDEEQTSSSSQDVAFVTVRTLVQNSMKGAYRDQLVKQILESSSLQPAKELLRELHQAIRQLIPSRIDLHSILKDEEITMSSNPKDLLACVLKAGRAMVQLEATARAETTTEWIHSTTAHIRTALPQTMDKPIVLYTVSSILYLLYKTELCEVDKQDFYLGHVWAPLIVAQGTTLERRGFERTFGPISSSKPPPATEAWLKTSVSKQSHDTRRNILESTTERKRFVFESWIRDIVFQRQSQVDLPEVLSLDMDRIESIRQVAKTAVIGSALALYACQVSGKPTSVLEEPIPAKSILDNRRISLVQAILETFKRQDQYERDVVHALVLLSREWDPSLDGSKQSILQSRAEKVLRGDDPVLNVLDRRIQDGFLETLSKYASLPSPHHMKTGQACSTHLRSGEQADLWKDSIQSFCHKGLSFYASDLALVSNLAYAVIDLAWTTYHDILLEPILLKACKESK